MGPVGISMEDSVNGFYNNIPKIRIKEYLPEIPADQWLNIFSTSYRQVSKLLEMVRDDPDGYKEKINLLMNSIKSGELVSEIIKGISSA